MALATNFQGLWWAAPAGVESGWGINFAHQGDTILATWFTFGLDGNPLWLIVSATGTAPNVYAGKLFTATGPAFNAVPFDPPGQGDRDRGRQGDLYVPGRQTVRRLPTP